MNERDSEQVARMFSEGGYTVTKDEFDADAILVNTCSVRDQAEQKALGKMGHMGKHRQRKPHVGQTRRLTTTQTVRSRIWMSRMIDQLTKYCRS